MDFLTEKGSQRFDGKNSYKMGGMGSKSAQRGGFYKRVIHFAPFVAKWGLAFQSKNNNCRIIIGSFFYRAESISSGYLMQYISNEEQQDQLLRVPQPVPFQQ